MNRRAAINLLMQSIYIIMLVILSTVLIFTMFAAKESALKDRLSGDRIGYAADLLSLILQRSECYTYTLYASEAPVRNQLDYQKIAASAEKNRDLHCIPYFDGIARLAITDLERAKTFNVSLDEERPSFAEESLTFTIPVAIVHSGLEINVGKARLDLFFGPVPDFYNAIKLATFGGPDARLPYYAAEQTAYDNTTNMFCYGSSCFGARFYAPVNSFNFTKGQYLVLIRKTPGSVEVKT